MATGTGNAQTTTGIVPLDRGLVLATSLGFAVVQLDVSVVNVATRPISDALGAGVSVARTRARSTCRGRSPRSSRSRRSPAR
jgi:hypothetical protein